MRDVISVIQSLHAYPFWAKVVLLGCLLIIGTVLFFARPEVTMDQKAKTDSAPNITITGDNAVVSSGQTGGVTARNVIVVQGATAAGARLVPLDSPTQQQQPDGTYLTTAKFLLESPFPVANLRLEVHGETITQMQFLPNRVGGVMIGNSGIRQGVAFTNLPNASGQYVLRVHSAKAEKFSLQYAVE